MTDSKSRNVLIVGTYSGLNKGDRIMQLVTARAIENLGLRPSICCPFPAIDSQFYPANWISKSSRRNLPLSLIYITALAVLPTRLRRTVAKWVPELRRFVEATLVIDTSGDMLTEDYGPHVALSHLVPLLYCLLLDQKLLVLAQSIGPFKRLGWLFDKVLSHAEKVTTRDDITFEYLKNRGIPNLENTADLGFLLKPKPNIADFSPDNSQEKEYRLIGICPSALFFKKFRRPNSEQSLHEFCRTLDRAAEAHRLRYVIIPHVQTPSGKMDDAELAEQLKEKLSTPCKIANPSLGPDEIKHHISELFAVITFRMHGAIAALDSYVPTLAISYSHKTEGLFAKLNLQKWVVANDKDLFVNLEKKIEELCGQRDVIEEHLRRVIPIIRSQAEKNLEIIEELAR